MLTRITDRKIPCVYIHVYRITKNWGPGPYSSLRHGDNKIFFGSLSNAKSKGSGHVLLGEGSGKICTCSCWEKDYFIMINEFKYGQTWNIWPSLLSLSIYSTFKMQGWLLLTLFICLHNQLGSFNSIIVPKNMIHQIGNKNEWLLFFVTFRQNLSWFLSSHSKTLFLRVFILKSTERA